MTHEQHRTSLTHLIAQASKTWHGLKVGQPDWGPRSYSIAFTADIRRQGLKVHLIFNAYWEPLMFELPSLQGGRPWQRWIDTSLDSPHDIVDWRAAPRVMGHEYAAADRSVVVLYAGSDAR